MSLRQPGSTDRCYDQSSYNERDYDNEQTVRYNGSAQTKVPRRPPGERRYERTKHPRRNVERTERYL